MLKKCDMNIMNPYIKQGGGGWGGEYLFNWLLHSEQNHGEVYNSVTSIIGNETISLLYLTKI